MKKLKSIKFYNFTIIATYISLNVRFFDEYGKLIVMDLSNYLSSTTRCCQYYSSKPWYNVRC